MDSYSAAVAAAPGGGEAVVTVTGSMTIEHAFDIKESLVAALDAADTLLFDIRGLSELDIIGLQFICSLHRSASAAGKVLEVRGLDMSTINDMVDQMYLKELRGLSYAKEANIDLLYMASPVHGTGGEEHHHGLHAVGARGDPQALPEVRRGLHENMAKARPLFVSEEGKATVAKLDKAWAEYLRGLANHGSPFSPFLPAPRQIDAESLLPHLDGGSRRHDRRIRLTVSSSTPPTFPPFQGEEQGGNGLRQKLPRFSTKQTYLFP